MYLFPSKSPGHHPSFAVAQIRDRDIRAGLSPRRLRLLTSHMPSRGSAAGQQAQRPHQVFFPARRATCQQTALKKVGSKREAGQKAASGHAAPRGPRRSACGRGPRNPCGVGAHPGQLPALGPWCRDRGCRLVRSRSAAPATRAMTRAHTWDGHGPCRRPGPATTSATMPANRASR